MKADYKEVHSLVMALLSTAAKAHVWHLGTKSYAQHKALGDLYGYLHEAADDLAEAAIGDGMEIKEPDLKEIEAELKKLCDRLAALKGEGWLTNIAQEIDGELYRYLYKLKRLK